MAIQKASSSIPPLQDCESPHRSSSEFTYPPSGIEMALQPASLLTLFPSCSSTSSECSGVSVFTDISSQSESSRSSVYGDVTPRKGAENPLCLSESPTPVEDD